MERYLLSEQELGDFKPTNGFPQAWVRRVEADMA